MRIPEGDGLAARYPGDRGIDRDPRVLLADGFDTGGIDDLARRWSDIKNPKGRALAFDDATPASGGAGRRALRVTATLGEDTGGHLFALLPRPAETLFARFYVRFAPDADFIHHFVWMGGQRPATRWPDPRAGERPRGDDRVSVGIEPHGGDGIAAPGQWSFYNYWQEMKISADRRYWGNAIRPETPVLVPRGRWQCVEFMTRLNTTPERGDGALALWLDGKLTLWAGPGSRRGPWTGLGFTVRERDGEPFAGFRWRTESDLRLNYFWLEHYVTKEAVRRAGNPNPQKTNTVWFDDIVVAESYIGPRRDGV